MLRACLTLLILLTAACTTNKTVVERIYDALGVEVEGGRSISIERAIWRDRSKSNGLVYLDGDGKTPVLALMTLQGSVKHVNRVSVSSCDGLDSAIQELLADVARSAETITGIVAVPHTDALVLDGAWYELVYFDGRYGSLSLRGTSQESMLVPWISASDRVLELAYGCAGA